MRMERLDINVRNNLFGARIVTYYETLKYGIIYFFAF